MHNGKGLISNTKWPTFSFGDYFWELIFSPVIYLGRWHDSKIAMSSVLYVSLQTEHLPRRKAMLRDSAFPRSAFNLSGNTLRGRKLSELGLNNDKPTSTRLATFDTLLELVIPSERQTEEWRVKSLESPFKRLGTTASVESCTRKRLLVFICYVHNFRVQCVVLNQIRTMYSNVESPTFPWVKKLETN